MIDRLKIRNYKRFREFSFECNPRLNILVGDNEAGKSTILEAINLALTMRINGRPIDTELSPHIFNKECSSEYVESVRSGANPSLPLMLIEVYLTEAPELQSLRGSNNTDGIDAIGIQLRIEFDDEYRDEYIKLLEDRENITLIPAEYYRSYLMSFAGNQVRPRNLGLGTSYIDATAIRIHGGIDYYLQTIVNGGLEPKERVGLSVAYRRLKEHFTDDAAVREVNGRLADRTAVISNKALVLGIDVSQRSTWEASLTPHLDALPLHLSGKGEQNATKIMLALERRVEKSQVVLIEEPENHLSFSSMNILVNKIRERCDGKQIFIATHSAYVLNRLGIENVALLRNGSGPMFLTSLSPETQAYFRRLSGYDTLRLILARRAILVEGPSDELIVQKAYLMRHGKLPIEDGIDVINVRGLSFARFLDIAHRTGVRTTVVTDNDGDYKRNVENRYSPYSDVPNIQICASSDDRLHTLEVHMCACNDMSVLNTILGKTYKEQASLLDYMKGNKTEWALRVFDAEEQIKIPEYIWEAVA